MGSTLYDDESFPDNNFHPVILTFDVMSPAIQPPKDRVFLFSHPRTASNLLVKLLSGQHGWAYDEYNFISPYLYAHSTVKDSASLSDHSTWTEYTQMRTSALEKLESFFLDAEQEVYQRSTDLIGDLLIGKSA